MIAAVVPDLMDRSRFVGFDVRFIQDPTDTDGADLVVVDLDRCDEIAGFARLAVRTIGFGAHVDSDRLLGARDAGFDRVMARSAFFRRLPELLGEMSSGPIDPTTG